MQILTIIMSYKKRWFYHLKFDFTSLFWTFQKWHLEVHRTIFKGNRGKKLFSILIWLKNGCFLVSKELFCKIMASKHRNLIICSMLKMNKIEIFKITLVQIHNMCMNQHVMLMVCSIQIMTKINNLKITIVQGNDIFNKKR